MPFHFSMQKILNYREQLEEEAKVRLATAQRMCMEEERRCQDLRTLLAEKEDQSRNIALSYGERWLLDNFIKGLRADMAASLLRLRSLRQATEQARLHMLERIKERKVLEKLKERQKERHDAEERDKERKTNDETATIRYIAPAF